MLDDLIFHVVSEQTCTIDCKMDQSPILQEILRIQNLHQVERHAFLELMHLFQSVGCVRNKLQFRTVQQIQKSFSLDAELRLDGIPALDLWDLIVAVLHGNTCQRNKA